MAVSTKKTRGGQARGQKMTPEIYFARKLAANDKKTRDRTLKKLTKWIGARSGVPDAFSEDELLKLWKGLFYCMWMSDKPLIQEDLAESISSLIHSVTNRQTGLKFTKIAFVSLAREWSGIDHWRMEKFAMFVRRILRHTFEYLRSNDWDMEEVGQFSSMFSESIINANKSTAQMKVPIGFQLHVINIFLEELAKVGKEELSSSVIVKLLEPFAKCLASSDDSRLKKEVHLYVFTYLIRQSDVVLDKNHRTVESSKKDRRVKDSDEPVIERDDDDELIGDGGSEDELQYEPKDPRAGGVSIVLPQLRPDFAQVADMVLKEASEKNVRNRNRKPMYKLVKRLKDAAAGVNPLIIRLPYVGQGITPKLVKEASRNYIKEQVETTKELEEERALYRKLLKAKRRNVQDEAEVSDEDIDEDGSNEDEEAEEDVEDEDLDDEEEEEEDEEDVDEEDEGEESDSEATDEDMGEDETVDDEEESEPPAKASKSNQGRKKVLGPTECKTSAGHFQVDDDWDARPEDGHRPATGKTQSRKADGKNMASSWSQSPTSGEVEIVIPNKKYRGPLRIKPPANSEVGNDETNNGNRRVNFILDKNTAQEPRDYQESVRKSPGIPHDPHRQPPSGGVLKRASASPASTSKRRKDASARLFPRV